MVTITYNTLQYICFTLETLWSFFHHPCPCNIYSAMYILGELILTVKFYFGYPIKISIKTVYERSSDLTFYNIFIIKCII